MTQPTQNIGSVQDRVYRAIDESKSSAIVDLQWSETAADLLFAECEEMISHAHGEYVYSGLDDDGRVWRVRLGRL